MRIKLSAALVFILFGAAIVIQWQAGSPSCPVPLKEDFLSAAARNNATILLRHAETCDDDEPDCSKDLTETGRNQAKATGAAITGLLGESTHVYHSPLARARDTAMAGFGKGIEVPQLSNTCKEGFTAFLETRQRDGNEVLVTHSTCLDTLTESGYATHHMDTGDDENFAVALLFSGDRFLGCMQSGDWSAWSAN